MLRKRIALPTRETRVIAWLMMIQASEGCNELRLGCALARRAAQSECLCLLALLHILTRHSRANPNMLDVLSWRGFLAWLVDRRNPWSVLHTHLFRRFTQREACGIVHHPAILVIAS